MRVAPLVSGWTAGSIWKDAYSVWVLALKTWSAFLINVLCVEFWEWWLFASDYCTDLIDNMCQLNYMVEGLISFLSTGGALQDTAWRWMGC